MNRMRRHRRGSLMAGVSRKRLTSLKKGEGTLTGGSCITGAPDESTREKLEVSMEVNDGSQQSQGTVKIEKIGTPDILEPFRENLPLEVCERVRLKQACTATETRRSLEILVIK